MPVRVFVALLELLDPALGVRVWVLVTLLDGVTEDVAVLEGDTVGVLLREPDLLALGVYVGVLLRVPVRVFVALLELLDPALGVRVWVLVTLLDGVPEGVRVLEGDTEGVLLREPDLLALGVYVGVLL